MEQSPSNETLSESAARQRVPSAERHGTIVGEGLASLCLTTSSITMVQPPPPAVLSFRDQTVCPLESSAPRTTAPSWQVYTSPEPPPKPETSVRPEPFTVMEDLDKPASPDRAQNQVCDVPMSPECALKPDWLAIRSPEVPVEHDLDAFLSPRRPKDADVPASPERLQSCADVPMSPEQPPQFSTWDGAMMSPDRQTGQSADVTMAAATPVRTAGVQLVPDPWDGELICDLLSALAPPLTSHPCCITWNCNIPAINPKTTISMGTPRGLLLSSVSSRLCERGALA